MRLLLVDDEARILEGLERMLMQVTDDDALAITTASGGSAALQALEAEPFDVVISDMRMPGMDGAELLARVHERWPATVRIVLSGHMGEEAALRSARYAHQFLAKPCGAAVLREALDRAQALTRVVASPAVRAAIGAVDRLPSVPEHFRQLEALLASEGADLTEIARVVERDPALTAKIMQMVNTAFFGRSAPASELHQAIARIGVRTLQALSLSAAVFQSAVEVRFPPCASVESLQQKSLLVARRARALAGERAFLAGLLADIGSLVVGRLFPVDRIPTGGVLDSDAQLAAENAALGTSHAEVGAYLLLLWAFPMETVEAVAQHHDLDAAGRGQPSVSAAVYWATRLVEGLPVTEQDLAVFGAGARAARELDA